VELDHLKDRYIAITSHEIRGPVSTMITAVETVRSRWDKLDPQRRDHLLEMVYLQGRELDRLVQDLFISAEMQGGGLNLQPEWVELDSTIKRAVEAAGGKRRAHLLELFVDPVRVELDPYRVTQIVRNLVENAYKYTHDRTRVVVSAKGVSGGVQIEVRDDGEGIPRDKRDKLFEAFSRIEETAAGQEGVGLGLYVVSQLVAAMNGRIDLQSSSRGTTFSIFLPCATAPLGKAHIGLVDDEVTHG
ncbi:MAG: HAMP domain-containing histidine kinase, partial [Actinobacteria bacterium]|nr:HAMP domain-containing histidine kinase [Actinomycetota bacterium]